MGPAPVEPSVAVQDQLQELSTVVEVGSVVGDGVVLVRADDAGSPGTVLGMLATADAGASPSSRITLDRPTTDGEQLHAAVHADAASLDTPLSPVVAFTVTHDSATVEVVLNLLNQSASSWTVDSVEPASYRDAHVSADPGNPTITFRAGWRYALVNRAIPGHPFELLTDVNPGLDADDVQLSQSIDGPLEATASWVEDGNVARFVVTPEVMSTVDFYRCSVHRGVMRGPVQFTSG